MQEVLTSVITDGAWDGPEGARIGFYGQALLARRARRLLLNQLHTTPMDVAVQH